MHIAYDAQISSSEAFTMLCDIVYGKARFMINAMHDTFMLHLGPHVVVDQYRINQVQYSGLAIAVQLQLRERDRNPSRVIVNPYQHPIVARERIRESIIDAEHWHRDIHPSYPTFG